MRSVAVVVVTYNSGAVLADCLASLPEGCAGVRLNRIVVADNASRDDTEAIAERAREAGLPLRVLRLGRNAGYAAAINAGVAAVHDTADDRPDAVLVLNPDATLRPGCVATLAARLDTPGVGIVSPRLIAPNGRLELSLRRGPTLIGLVAEAVLGGAFADRYVRRGDVVHDPARYERPGPADWTTGACWLMSSEMLARLGGWDESFLLYSEETEFALRAADEGWTVWHDPAAVADHIGGESTTSPMLWALLTFNRLRLYRMRRGAVRALAYGAVLTAGQAARALAGRRTARAAVATLLLRSRRLTELPQ